MADGGEMVKCDWLVSARCMLACRIGRLSAAKAFARTRRLLERLRVIAPGRAVRRILAICGGFGSFSHRPGCCGQAYLSWYIILRDFLPEFLRIWRDKLLLLPEHISTFSYSPLTTSLYHEASFRSSYQLSGGGCVRQVPKWGIPP